MSKTQLDRLGDRLRRGNITEADLRLLDLYRRSFSDAYEFVVGAIRGTLILEPTGRPAKSTTSISEKLRRESIRLTQIQDIAGCRLTVSDIKMQNFVVESIQSLFGHPAVVIDRRQQPSHGYRAVHVVMNVRGKLIEIQVRTELQHLWAELSEKFSDIIDPAIKYGGGDRSVQELLVAASTGVELAETVETQMAEILVKKSSIEILPADLDEMIERSQAISTSARQQLVKNLNEIIIALEEGEGENDALSD